MILLFTDFGTDGPYLGQMTAVLAREAPGVPVIPLFSDAPAFDPRASAYLLAAYTREVPAGTVILGVVDPGVGGPRKPLALQAGGRWYVGPDNGLFALAARAEPGSRVWEITWRPERLSASFHGRDLFAPVAARLARGEAPPGRERGADEAAQAPGTDWPDDLAEVIYLDHYGNAITGLRAASLAPDATLEAAGQRLRRARTFSGQPHGTAFWYENANGLAEISLNRGRAADSLSLVVGSPVLPGPKA